MRHETRTLGIDVCGFDRRHIFHLIIECKNKRDLKTLIEITIRCHKRRFLKSLWQMLLIAGLFFSTSLKFLKFLSTNKKKTIQIGSKIKKKFLLFFAWKILFYRYCFKKAHVIHTTCNLKSHMTKNMSPFEAMSWNENGWKNGELCRWHSEETLVVACRNNVWRIDWRAMRRGETVECGERQSESRKLNSREKSIGNRRD